LVRAGFGDSDRAVVVGDFGICVNVAATVQSAVIAAVV